MYSYFSKLIKPCFYIMSKNKTKHSTKKSLDLLNYTLFPFKNNKQAYIVLALIGFVFYINTIYNEFALDDGIVIHKNEFVMKGSSGIKDILSHDAYYSFYRQMNADDQLAGGRYRPLSIVSFSIEQNFIGTHKKGKLEPNSWDLNKNQKPDENEDTNEDGLYNEYDTLVKGCGLRHFNNMLFFVVSVLLLFYFLKNYIFTSKPDLAFLSALIFCIHPIHTEVVANMKSRDEIFSLIFILLTFIFVLKTLQTSSVRNLVLSGVMYLLALLSKEYAVTLLALVPLMVMIFRPAQINLKNTSLWLFAGLFMISAYIMYYFEAHDKNYFKIVPLLFAIISPFLFMKDFKSKNFVSILCVLGIAFLTYLAMRFHATVLNPKAAKVGEEILNDPYLLIKNSPLQIYATKLFVLLKYIALLFFPSSLSSDYSYNTIAYRTFASWDTLLSLVVHVSLIVLTIVLFKRKHPLSFALLFYFANLFMIGNIVLDIGATMGERLIYHSSVGFAIAIAWLLTEGLKKIIPTLKTQAALVMGFALIVTVLCGFKTIQRNAEWKNDITLFTTDVNTVPNSVMCLGNAGARWIDLSDKPGNSLHAKEYRLKAVGYLTHALQLHPKYVNGYLNLGLAYYKLNEFEKAEETWVKAKKLYPGNPFLVTYYQLLANYYVLKGNELGKAGNFTGAIQQMEKASQYNPNDPEIWYNLGGASYMMKDFAKAKFYFENCLRLKPDHKLAQQGYASVPK